MTPGSLCDKCHKPVDPKNDAAALDVQLAVDRGLMDVALWKTFTQSSRHLLPTSECEGSPSRAQYLEGRPRDTRPEYPYNERAEPLVRAAYAEMQEWTETPKLATGGSL